MQKEKKMNEKEAAAIFGEKIKYYLRRAKVKQLELAKLLDITPSAICQMIKCRILMNLKQLSTVGHFLELSEDEMLEMQVLLTNLRNGESDLLTHFNRFMRKCRKDKGLSLTKLAQITGISAVRLRSFESDFNAYFTLEDAEKLSKVYGITPDMMMKKIPDLSLEDITYPSHAQKVLPGVLEVAERGQTYIPETRIPVVALEDFLAFHDENDLFIFGDVRSQEEIAYDIDKKVVGVRAVAKDFGIDVPGDVIFFVTDRIPLIYVCSLYLCLDSSRKFRVLQKMENSNDFYYVMPSGEKEVFDEKINWSLGIIDIKFSPKLLV